MTVVEEKIALLKGQNQRTAPGSDSASIQESASSDNISEPLVSDGFILPEMEVPDEAPPAYGEYHDRMQFSQPGFDAGAAVTDDGRVNININTKNRRLADLLAPVLANQISAASQEQPPAYLPPSLIGVPDGTPPPRLNIVIQIVGSRGDVQPFVALGKTLKEKNGHRVRVATHPTFQTFVEENDLEFFNIGGDPAELMAFMVKHPGLMPGMDALKSGEVSKRRKGIEEMLLGCWRSCIERGNGLGPPPKPHKKDEPLDLVDSVEFDGGDKPFVADAIIANPPSFAHIHVAEKLGIPLHMMFTMPWSPTRAFPHPLANIQSSNADDIMTNNLTYTLVEMMTWQGLGDIINRFREKVLDLPALSLIWAPGLLNRLKVPYTYCWSPALIPKPNDWGRNIDISGFFFLNLASNYTPDPELDAFLKAGSPPVYIGFGSIVVDDPNAMTKMIFDAIKLAGIRALVSKGWGGLGADDLGIPEGVHMLGNVPHDWLFQHVASVVHHGGAGTTAAGIKAGKPTFVVPFFGDQPFWGSMVARANAGPEPIPYKELTAEKLADAIKFCLKPDTIEQAKVLGEKIREENGTEVGSDCFQKHLDIASMRCSLAPTRVAVWRVRRTKVRLSTFAATVLVKQGLIKYSDLKLYRSTEYNTEDQPPEPISAGASSLVADISGMGMAIADMPRGIWKSHKKQKDSKSVKAGDDNSGSNSNAPTTPESASILSREPSETVHGSTTATDTNASQQSLVETDSQSPSIKTEESSRTKSSTSRTSTLGKQTPPVNASNPGDSAAFSRDAAVGAARSVERVVTTGVKSPMNFCLGLAKGFRNIPRLYNDDTVRPIEKVTNLSSGVRVAGKELGLGLFDGIAGLVTQPLRGAEKEGAAGLVKGFGKGIGGLVAKPAAGFWGVPAYMMQGVHAEIQKLFSRSVLNYIITSRVQQGELDRKDSTTEEQNDVVRHWHNVQQDLHQFYALKQKSKGKGVADKTSSTQSGGDNSQGTASAKQKPMAWLQNRMMMNEQRKRVGNDGTATQGGNLRADQPLVVESETSELENAIQTSVKMTSNGNAEDDAMVEAAIRESIKAVQNRSADNSTSTSALLEKNPNIFDDADYQINDEEYQNLIEQAIQQSLGGHDHDSPVGQIHGVGAPGMLDQKKKLPPPQDDDLYEPMNASQKANPPPAPPPDYDHDLNQAIAASKDDMHKTQNDRTEEDIVLEYVKKQSLAEEEFRKQSLKGQEIPKNSEDEDLRRAMEESLKLSGKDATSGPS